MFGNTVGLFPSEGDFTDGKIYVSHPFVSESGVDFVYNILFHELKLLHPDGVGNLDEKGVVPELEGIGLCGYSLTDRFVPRLDEKGVRNIKKNLSPLQGLVEEITQFKQVFLLLSHSTHGFFSHKGSLQSIKNDGS
jgi:hypothetical protein